MGLISGPDSGVGLNDELGIFGGSVDDQLDTSAGVREGPDGACGAAFVEGVVEVGGPQFAIDILNECAHAARGSVGQDLVRPDVDQGAGRIVEMHEVFGIWVAIGSSRILRLDGGRLQDLQGSHQCALLQTR